MRALIAAAGTGGHIYPGIAVAKEILRRNPESEIRFVGTARGLEGKLVPKAGFELSIIESAGLKSVGSIARLRGAAMLPRSFMAARRIIRDFRPDVVIGAGGYVSGPVVLTAAVSFEKSLSFFRGKGVVTGNPVRREFFEIPARLRTSGGFNILVFGGSQGAHAINEAMVAALPELEGLRNSLRVTHQTGEADFERVRSAYIEAGWSEQADVRRYIDDMVVSFGEADLVICRAGATTTAELIAAGKASIMIPFPLAADDHQRRNAEALEAEGAAKMILQQDLSGRRLAQEIEKLLQSPDIIKSMESASHKLARGDAAAAAVDLIEELIS